MQNDVFTTGETLFGLSQVLTNTNKAGHSLVRTAGSFVTINGSKIADPVLTEVFLTKLNLVERTDEIKEMGEAYGTCRYFSSPVPNGGFEAFQGAVSLNEFVQICYENDLVMDVEVNPTKEYGGSATHQNEIVSKSVTVQKVNEIWVIVGNGNNPHEDWSWEDGMIYTWHPGRVYGRHETVVKLKE